MNRPTKRLLALAGSALLGTFAAVALATPAQAHHADLIGQGVCQDDGTYDVTWRLTHPENWSGRIAKITGITKSVDKPITPVAPATSFAVGTEINPVTTISGVQNVPTASATLKVDTQWFNTDGTPAKHTDGRDITDSDTVNATFDVTTCQPKPIPSATFLPFCDGTIKVHLINPTGSPVVFTVTAGNGWTQQFKIPANGKLDVIVPADNAKAEIVVKAGKDEIAKGGPWVRPNCPKPTPLGESTCDKFTVSLSNPADNLPTTATVTYGSQVVTKEIAAGRTEKVELSPSSETEATIKFSSWDDVYKVKYEKPANCGGLPQTGASTGTYVASGSGLAALGVLVFFLARRRQVRLRRIASL